MNHLLKVLQGETLQGCKVSPCRRKGFTLIELLVVIAVLAVISAGILTALNITGTFDKGRVTRGKAFNKSLEHALSVSQVGKWSFEESSSPFKDTSGNGNDGSCSSTSCPTPQNSSNCKLGFGNCLSFEGNDHINLPKRDIFDFGTGDFTISAWVNAPSGSTRRFIYGKSGTSTVFELSFYISDADKLGLEFEGTLIPELSPSKVVGDGKWHHVAVTRSSGIVKLYVDGAQDGSAGSSNADLSSNGTERIGQSGNVYAQDPFKGMMDEVAMYNEALTAFQIHQLYAQGLPRHQLAHK